MSYLAPLEVNSSSSLVKKASRAASIAPTVKKEIENSSSFSIVLVIETISPAKALRLVGSPSVKTKRTVPS